MEEYAFKKWGSEQGLDDEFDRRETEKRQRKEKKFNAKLKGNFFFFDSKIYIYIYIYFLKKFYILTLFYYFIS